ncbi:DUF1353 domain-containing protein [Asticcacaulis sp. EMRT-3]|uniref:DUF1353 domain-containing protein n=1 Tax=Asticcacaulis sp. EMRT-3 TaxID=3040349 RepID=UPI0024AFF186|nr:DUF1353 domain-containing protein [Asticcacaulis sp. EMRT-3]MDI7774605.1 DUF1353 domain-containing protein [Asticcacaulis sp. EMRT-3]
MRSLTYLALSALIALTACASETTTKTVYVPVVAPVAPSSLTPLPIMLFNQTKQGRKLFTLDAEFPYCDPVTGMVIVVPKWYVTDFASVPWYGQGLIDPQGPTARAAIIHDWLYTIGEPGKREVADAIFYRAMLKYGVSEFQARIAYNAVRTGGEGGYGLASDWVFIDPTRQNVRQPPPFAKPATGAVRIMPGCRGFDQLIQSGWRAYPDKPVQIAVPPPVVVTEKPLDNLISDLPWQKKSKSGR